MTDTRVRRSRTGTCSPSCGRWAGRRQSAPGFYYRYSHDNARRTLHGIDQQITKAERAVAGQTPVKRNWISTLTAADKSVNRALEARVRGLAGIKGYATNLVDWPAERVIAAYHQLYQVEKSFRMSKSNL